MGGQSDRTAAQDVVGPKGAAAVPAGAGPGAVQPRIGDAATRSRLYSVLSAAFYRPDARAAELEDIMVKILSVSGNAPLDQEAANRPGALKTAQTLEVEYNRLFVGPGHLRCPPYESVYERDRPSDEIGLLAGPVVPEINRLYAEAGFRLSDSFRDYPDHIAAELEFMGHLCARESESAEDEAEKWSAYEAKFVNGHLGTWAEKFADSVLAATASPFYLAAATLLKQLAFDEAATYRRRG